MDFLRIESRFYGNTRIHLLFNIQSTLSFSNLNLITKIENVDRTECFCVNIKKMSFSTNLNLHI